MTPHCNRSPGRAHRIAGLDGLRAIAVAAVFLYHAGVSWIPGGFLGVDMFFVLSGFLITHLLLQELAGTGKLDLRGFYARRARRLLPAVLVLLIAVLIGAAIAWPDSAGEARDDAIAASVYATNWWFIGHHVSYFVATGRPPLLQHLWSLAIEEQFYLLWPVAVVVGAAVDRRRGRGHAVTWVAGLGALASTAWMAWLAIHGNVPYDTNASRLYFGTDTHAAGLLVGCGAASILASRGAISMRRRGRAVIDSVAVASLGMLALSLHRINEFSPTLYRGGFLVIALLCAVVIVDLAIPGSSVARTLDRAPMRWLGTRSYSIYLWHWPVIDVTRPGLDVHLSAWPLLLARIAVTTTLAELSYRWVEQPFRRRHAQGSWTPREARHRRDIQRVAVAVAITFALASWTAAGRLEIPASAVSGAPSPPDPQRSALLGPVASGHGTGSTAPTRHPHRRSRARPSITAVGDSVLLGAARQLQQLDPDVRIDAAVARQAPAVFAELSDLERSGRLSRDVVIETGDNGIVSGKELSAAIDRLGDRRVVLINNDVPRPWEQPNNATFRAVASAHANVLVVDWRSAAHQHPGWLWSDGVHLRDAGASAYAGLIMKAFSS